MTTTPVTPVDPSQICLTGENSFIRLAPEADAPQTTRVSHWRVLWSPAGAGHTLFLKTDHLNANPGSDAGPDADTVRIYADNIALARYLQTEIETMLFPEFANPDLPVISARFAKDGAIPNFWNETVIAATETIVLSWHDFITPYMLNNPAGGVSGRTHGVYSCFFPARRAQITVNDRALPGVVSPEMRGPAQSSSACIAWSETWVKPA